MSSALNALPSVPFLNHAGSEGCVWRKESLGLNIISLALHQHQKQFSLWGLKCVFL